ncbi:MAG: hypothetical protein HY785_24840 [Oscillatoriophycideae cyanobacterium NC_groundwater_1537_Pr4_S-0.65um_50_18]|jgi:2-polyprenyl-6-methoxyphenol hydroxylase-like FAD-dependent oxidoreductase|nr:hypothetical protein [Oscillatoriophycideae cyanobacterium NC_groundwater_1537_Pr4_S-0.65um_50_18]
MNLDHAVVIGASISGLLTARVLSDYFRQVTLLDRDSLPTSAAHRQGVPQGCHLHVLQAKGEQILSQFFPGLEIELLQAGATRLDLGSDLFWYQYGGYRVRFNSGITALCLSRPLLEASVRRRVLTLQNLTCLERCAVQGLVAHEDRSRVTGVRIQQRSEGLPEETLAADLVVDASGRGSRTPTWLEALGYSRPQETVIKVGVGYTTRIYQQKAQALSQAKAVFIPPVPPQGKRGGGLFPIEGDRWIVTLVGWFGDHAPTEEQGFLNYARSLACQDIYKAISQTEPLSAFTTHRFPSNLRRHYEQLQRFPAGYLVIGDAICSFNPAYGQGMSASALTAAALDRCLQAASRRNTWHRLAQDYFQSAAEAISNPWRVTVGEDFRFPEVEGAKPIGTDWINGYMANLQKTTLRDPEISRTLLQVMTLTHSPKILFSPKVILRVIKDHWEFRYAERTP